MLVSTKLSLPLLLLTGLSAALPLHGNTDSALSRRAFPLVSGLEKIGKDLPVSDTLGSIEKNGGLWLKKLEDIKKSPPAPPTDIGKFTSSYVATDSQHALNDLHSTIKNDDDVMKALGHDKTEIFNKVDLKPPGGAKSPFEQALDKDGKTLINLHSFSKEDKDGKAQMPWEDIQTYVAGRNSAPGKDLAKADLAASAKKVEQIANINIANDHTLGAIDKVYSDMGWSKVMKMNEFKTLDKSNPLHAKAIDQLVGTDNGKLGVKWLGTNMKNLDGKDIDKLLIRKKGGHMIMKFK